MSDISTLTAVTDDTFADEVERRPGLTIVDCWASWCAPCRLVTPVLERLAAEHADRARTVTLDADANPRTTVRFGVRALPTLLFFSDGRLVDRVVGAVPRAAIEAKLLQHAS